MPDSPSSLEKIPPSLSSSAAEEFNSLLGELARRQEIQKLETDLLLFSKAAWPIVEKSRSFSQNWHHEIICRHLEAVLDGKIRNLIINVPPRSTKSTLTSIMLPAFAWAKKPALKFLFASFKESLALLHSQYCRDIFESAWYRERWPKVKIRLDKDSQQMFANVETGYRAAVSVGASPTGIGGDILVIDDAHALSDTFGEADREAAVRWWDTTMASRLNDRLTGARIVIGQRVHEADLTGHLLKQGGWTHVRIPAEYEPTKTYSSPIGANDPRKEQGELLWPDRFPKSVQEEIKRENGSFAYSSQQQQDPAPGEAGVFHRKYFRYFSIEGDTYVFTGTDGAMKRVPKGACSHFQSFDTATKLRDFNDYTVSGTFAITPEHQLLVVDIVRVRVPVPMLFPFTVEMRAKHPSILYQYVEDKSSGQGLIQEGERSAFPFFNLAQRLKDLNIPAAIISGDKMQRSTSVAILYEAGKVYHLSGASWLPDFESEILHFPTGSFDDQVDVLSYSAILMQYGPRTDAAGDYRGKTEPTPSAAVEYGLADRLPFDRSEDQPSRAPREWRADDPRPGNPFRALGGGRSPFGRDGRMGGG